MTGNPMFNEDFGLTTRLADPAYLPHCNHVVQIYKNDIVLIESLSGFVAEGFRSGETSIIIATATHLELLQARLKEDKFDIEDLQQKGLYIPLDASDLLSTFMVNGWPDETKFFSAVSQILVTAGYPGHPIRAFGEMVAILWDKGQNAATIYLEDLWNKFCASHPLCLYCAYPESAFTDNLKSSIQHICRAHAAIVGGMPEGHENLTGMITRQA